MQIKLTQFLLRPLSRFGISHHIQATALWSMLESFSSPLFSLLLIPIFTHYMGLENYGLYVMVMAFVSFFGFTGLGMSTSITYYLAANYQTITPKHIGQLLGSALFLTIISTVIFSGLFILCFNLFYSSINLHYPQLIAQQHLIYAALFLITITQLDSVVSSSLKGLQQFKVSSKVEFVLRLLSFVAISLVAITQKNVSAVILVCLAMAIINLIIRYITLNKTALFQFSDIKLHKKSVNELFYFGKWMTLQSISVSFFGSIDKLIVGSLLGNTVLAIYNVLLCVTQLIHYIPASMLNFVLPKVAKNNVNLTFNVLKKLFLFTSLISIFIALIIVLAKKIIFIKFNIDNTYDTFFYWLVLTYALLSLNTPSYFIALGMNLIKAVSLQCIIGALIGTSALLILTSKYGLVGVVVSKLIYSILAIFLVIPIIRKVNFN